MMRKLSFALLLALSVWPAFGQAPAPVPALPDTERRTSYSISASTCACAVGFQLYQDSTDVTNWIEVFVNGVKVTQSGNWSITSPSGPINLLARPITDAVLTFTVAQTGTVQIIGAQRPRRLTEVSENRGVAARDFNQFANGVTAQLREVWDRFLRTPRVPPGETLSLLPPLASRQNMGACFDANGNLQPCTTIPSGAIIAGAGITFTGTNPTTISLTPTPATVSPVVPSRAIAITQDLHTQSVVQTGGYATGGDGGGATFKNVGTAPFIDGFANACTIVGGSAYTNGTYFGIALTGGTGKGIIAVITVSGGAVTGVNYANTPGNAYTAGDVLTSSNAPIGGTGSGFTCTIPSVSTPLASFTDSVGTHFQYIPTGSPNVLQFGAVADWAGTDASATDNYSAIQAAIWYTTNLQSFALFGAGGWWGGKVFFPQGSFKVCGTGLKSLIVSNQVTLEGVAPNAATLRMCDAFDSGTHFSELGDPNWHSACFGARMNNLTLSASRTVTASNQIYMVHSNCTQDWGGLTYVKIGGGQRGCFWYQKGYGGASVVDLNHVDCGGNGTATMIQIGDTIGSGNNVGSTIFIMNTIELQGPSSAPLQTGAGMNIFGGFVDVTGVHCESVSTCIGVTIGATGNGDMVRIHNLNHANTGGTACTGAIQLSNTNTFGNTIIGQVPAGGCPHVVLNGQSGGSNRDTAIGLDVVFNP